MNASVRFEDEADEEYRLAVALPHAGSLVPGLPPELPVRRRAVMRFPYHVVYLDTSPHIRILAIAHDRRKPGYWQERLR